MSKNNNKSKAQLLKQIAQMVAKIHDAAHERPDVIIEKTMIRNDLMMHRQEFVEDVKEAGQIQPELAAETRLLCDANTSPLRFDTTTSMTKKMQDPIASKYLNASPSTPPQFSQQQPSLPMKTQQVNSNQMANSQNEISSRKRTYEQFNQDRDVSMKSSHLSQNTITVLMSAQKNTKGKIDTVMEPTKSELLVNDLQNLSLQEDDHPEEPADFSEKENIPPEGSRKKFKMSKSPGKSPVKEVYVSSEVPIKTPLPRPQMNMVEPSYIGEFNECSSNYELPLKEDSEQISSDGEFEDAKRMEVYHEDDDEVLKIEEIKAWQEQTGLNIHPPDQVINDAIKSKRVTGTKNARQKGLKHFNKVGYQGFDNKSVPRWATDDTMLLKVQAYQRANLNPDLIFGRLNPKAVDSQFNLENIFSKGMKPESYDDMDFERGSSADWNDNSEFKSVIASPGKSPFTHGNFKAYQEVKNLSVSAGPYGLKPMDISQFSDAKARLSHITEKDAESKSKRGATSGVFFDPFKGGSFGGQKLPEEANVPLQNTENINAQNQSFGNMH